MLEIARGQQTARRCQNCGAHVTSDFTRVFGDENNDVHGCFDCQSHTDVKNGSACRADTDEVMG